MSTAKKAATVTFVKADSKKRVLRTVALLSVGALVGLPLGSYLVQHKFIDKEKALGITVEEGLIDDFAKKQFLNADPQNAREALVYAVEIHRGMQGRSTLSGWREKADLGWCYAELSLIEESTGNTNLAKDYMSQARQILKELGLKDSSESHIRELLVRKPLSGQPASEELK